MKTRQVIVALCLVICSASFSKASSQDQASSAKSREKALAAKSQPQHEDDGTRIFNQNCSRCHNTPESFSPRIAGTVVRHMRVRASLSKEDEKQLLRFFNP